jgi:hypothetical protein
LPLRYDNNNIGFLIEDKLKTIYITNLLNSMVDNGILVPLFLTDPNFINNLNVFIRKNPINSNIKNLLILDIHLKDYLKFINNEQITDIQNTQIDTINSIIKSDNLNDSGFVRFVFDMRSGICLCGVIDIYINKYTFIRKLNNLSFTIMNNKISNLTRYVQLDNIKTPRSQYKYMSNPNIGVLDVETFVNNQGLSQVYSLGYSTLQDKGTVTTFYLTDYSSSLNSNFFIITCINSLLISKYNNYYFYIHNMGKFDIVYIYKTLEDYNLQLNKKHYLLNTNYKDNKMLRLVIKLKLKNNKYIKITLVDSYNILDKSLDTLTKDFKVKYLKGQFPFKFVNENNLTYIGETPSFNYYNKINLSDYSKIYSSHHWSLKEETLKYLKSDVLGLLEVLEKFKSYLYIEHNLELTEGLTISRLALNKYLNNYMNEFKLPLINKFNIYNFIYFGYYGGRTEVFKPYGKKLYYYDVNSLYPYAALNNMAGIKAYYLKSLTSEGLNLDNLFGVFKAKVISNNNNLGLLPVKTKLGLIFPKGEYEGI